MSNYIVIGSQWGDEGKGKIVDLLTEKASAIMRFQGGNNAGHTVMFEDKTYILHLIPSGILHEGKTSIIGNGVVVDLEALLEEIKMLKTQGVGCKGKLFISDCAHVIMPYHKLIDQAREIRLDKNKIGTTGRGIGPAYEDKVARVAIRMVDIENTESFKQKIKDILIEKNKYLSEILGYEGELLKTESVFQDLLEKYEEVKDYIIDTMPLLEKLIDNKENILLEGAQGTFLDVDHGTYPFVTSSNTTAGGACTGTGLPPNQIDGVLGVVKAYTTRVGSGPFPSELNEAESEKLRKIGGEFGATTGRARRVGWFDACLLREAVFKNGMTDLAITKLDILDDFDSLRICVAYEDKQGKRYDRLPHHPKLQGEVVGVYEEIEGWKARTSGLTNYDDLPQKAKNYLNRISELLKVQISIVSTGPKREETIIVKPIF